MPTKLLLQSLFAILLLSSCSMTIPDVKIYSVAGRLQAGMDYSYTGHDETGEIGMPDSIKFLEAGALCMSSDDYKRQKTAYETACYKLGAGCTYEMKQAMKAVDQRVTAMQMKAKK